MDAENSAKELQAMGKSLQETGFSPEEVEAILCREVAPVCGRWMRSPGAIGPWPMFDEQDLEQRIGDRLHKPWYKPPLFHTGLLLMPGVRREWDVVRNAMRGGPDVSPVNH